VSVARALESLPGHLVERSRLLGTPGTTPRFVLYWMRTAVRAHENPALDAAAELARQLGVPMFCYHAVSERYPYASDRHHTFILEGARDVRRQMFERGVGYAFHLEREGHRGRHLATLANDAGLVVTEDMPVSPLRDWSEALAREVPVVLVDTACVVPMRLTARPARAFAYRKATRELREARLAVPWVDAEVPPYFVPELPFEPIDFRTPIPELVALCEIDHGVAPVHDTPGGSAAGYERWTRFREGALRRYAKDRNDPARLGVSRMSAYLHYGFVSPFRLARDATRAGGQGAAKFLDELGVWRELAHAFCFHTPEHDTLDALPGWARDTLRRHAASPRAAHYSWETLARSQTGETLWDLAQTSLRMHGELHNNVRMTWGKALLGWTRDPGEALARMIDLNHRYALDGRDPASYGGILWCLGLFDRPFEPAEPIRGTVRPRPLDAHERRIELLAYKAHVLRPAHELGPVAVIGAGVAGLACARTLADHDVEVRVFDKGRSVGGRLATREQDGRQLDHGAQYLTARDPRFVRFVRSWMQDSVVARWDYRERDAGGATQSRSRPVGAGMNRSLPEHLARGLEVQSRTKVAPLPADDLVLEDDSRNALGRFSHVVVTAPLAQARELLHRHPRLVDRIARGSHAPCWALMVELATRPAEVDVLRFDGPLAWVARDASKPGRPESETWVLHASPSWSREHLEEEPGAIAEQLLEAFAAEVGALPEVRFQVAHRWRYARVETPLGVPCVFDEEAGIVVAGDGCLGPRIEAAWLSGVAAAGRLLGVAGR